MSTSSSSRTAVRVRVGFLLVLLALAIPSAQASGVAGVLPDASPDSLMILVPPRATDAVNQDLAVAEAMETASSADLVAAQGRLGEAKARVDVCSSEIEALKAKIKLAKEQKNQVEQTNLELQVKAKELQLDALKARKEMRDAEVSLADARRKAAQTQSAGFRKELELLGKRNDLTSLRASGSGATNLDSLMRLQVEIRDLEGRCLEILKDAAEKEKSLADNEANLLEKRLKLQQAQIAFLAGPKK